MYCQQPAESDVHVQSLRMLRYLLHQSSDFQESQCRELWCCPGLHASTSSRLKISTNVVVTPYAGSVCSRRFECSTVDVLCRYDMVTVLCQVLNGVGDSCCTGSYCKSCYTAFQCCDSLFKYIFCRVGQTSVNVTCICQSETCCCMIAVTEYIRRSLINRNCSCISNRIRTVPVLHEAEVFQI